MNNKILPFIALLLAIVVIILAVVLCNSGNKAEDFTSETSAPGDSIDGDNETPSTETAEIEETSEINETPTADRPLAGLTICIDPGHQKQQNKDTEDLAPWDNTQKQKVSSGTCGVFTGIDEYVVNLEISLKIKNTLENAGATVVMTRETHDVDLSNIDRAEIGNNCNADVVLRIHCNGSDNASVEGIELWVPGNGSGTAEYKALAAYDKSLATELLTYLCDATGAKKRDVYTSDKYTGLNWSTVPSIIIECGFMSNEKEDNLLVTSEYQQKFADGILNWLTNSTVLKR